MFRLVMFDADGQAVHAGPDGYLEETSPTEMKDPDTLADAAKTLVFYYGFPHWRIYRIETGEIVRWWSERGG